MPRILLRALRFCPVLLLCLIAGWWAPAASAEEAGWVDLRYVVTGGPVTLSAGPEATWNGPGVEVPGGFTELLPSWNVVLPVGDEGEPRGGVRFEVSVRTGPPVAPGGSGGAGGAGGSWSPWLWIGSWGPDPTAASTAITEFAGGKVYIDILKLRQPADAFRLRARRVDDIPSPALLKRVVVVTSRSGNAPASATAGAEGSALPAVDLDVPFLPQGDLPEAIRSRACSPTATAMVMAYHGVDLPLPAHAAGVHDPDHDIYGNWGRNVAWAGQHGLHAELARVRSWEQVAEHLQAGRPLVASFRFDAGEFDSYLMEDTAGHLVVVRGLTDDGRVILNDPASRAKGEGLVVDRHEMGRAWFGHGGVTYVIRPAD